MWKNTFRCLFVAINLYAAQSSWAAVKQYHLNISEQVINLTGKPVKKIMVNGQFTAPTLTFEEGDDAVIVVKNQLKNQDSSVHWHGLLLPGLMDGVPDFNQYKAIKSGDSFVYRFKIRQNGTYWYHSHSKGQEQDGLYGAFIVYPKDKKPLTPAEYSDQDYVVMLSDFHETDSQSIMNNLKKSSDYYQNQRETVFDVFNQIKNSGFSATWQDRKMWNQMRMLKTDLSDVTGYTFLTNAKTPEQNWTAKFNRGDKVRLRFINAAAMSFFDVRIPNLKMTVVSADGQAVQPVQVDEFRLGTAETYDVIVEPKDSQYQIQAESIDRSGFALSTLLQNGATAKVLPAPTPRPRALLTMADMPMAQMKGDHSGHNMSNMQSEATSQHDMSKMMGDHSQHDMSKMMSECCQHDMSKMMGDHSQHDMSKMMSEGCQHDMSKMMSEGCQHDMSKMMGDHSQHDMSKMQDGMQENTATQSATALGWANASTPQGHKALQYADLKSLKPQTDLRNAEREIVIELGGSMERYIWTMDGKTVNEATPIQVKYGERVRLKFVNNSMMAHPMHLHGMFMQLENGQSLQDLPNKHTLVVPPNKTVTALLTADELGEWAIHCHLMYHMSAGMMNKLVVANVAPAAPKQASSAQGEHNGHH